MGGKDRKKQEKGIGYWGFQRSEGEYSVKGDNEMHSANPCGSLTYHYSNSR